MAKKKKSFMEIFTNPSERLDDKSTFFRVMVKDCLDAAKRSSWFDSLVTMFFNRKGINAETQDALLTEEEMKTSTENWKKAYDLRDNTMLMQCGLLHYVKGLVTITGPARSSKSRLATVLKVKRPPVNIFAAPLVFKNWHEAQYYLQVIDICDDTTTRNKKIMKVMSEDKYFTSDPNNLLTDVHTAFDKLTEVQKSLNLQAATNNSDTINVRKQKQREVVIAPKSKTSQAYSYAGTLKNRKNAREKLKAALIAQQDFNQPFSELATINSSGIEFQLRAKALSNQTSLTPDDIEFIVMNSTNAPLSYYNDVHNLCSILSLAQIFTGNHLEIKWYSEKMELFPLENQVIITKYDTDNLHYVRFRNIVIPIQLSARLVVFASTFFGITYVNSMNQNFFDFKKSGSVQGGLPIGYIDAIANFDNILSEYGRMLIVELRDDYSRNNEFEQKLVGAGSAVIVLESNEEAGIHIDISSSRIRPMTDFFDGGFANQMHDDFPVYLKYLEVHVNDILNHMSTSSVIRDSYEDSSYVGIVFDTPSDGR